MVHTSSLHIRWLMLILSIALLLCEETAEAAKQTKIAAHSISILTATQTWSDSFVKLDSFIHFGKTYVDGITVCHSDL